MKRRVWLVALGFVAACSSRDQSLGETRPSPPAIIVSAPTPSARGLDVDHGTCHCWRPVRADARDSSGLQAGAGERIARARIGTVARKPAFNAVARKRIAMPVMTVSVRFALDAAAAVDRAHASDRGRTALDVRVALVANRALLVAAMGGWRAVHLFAATSQAVVS